MGFAIERGYGSEKRRPSTSASKLLVADGNLVTLASSPIASWRGAAGAFGKLKLSAKVSIASSVGLVDIMISHEDEEEFSLFVFKGKCGVGSAVF